MAFLSTIHPATCGLYHTPFIHHSASLSAISLPYRTVPYHCQTSVQRLYYVIPSGFRYFVQRLQYTFRSGSRYFVLLSASLGSPPPRPPISTYFNSLLDYSTYSSTSYVDGIKIIKQSIFKLSNCVQLLMFLALHLASL